MRLLTSTNFDGVICAVLLRHVEQITEILYADPLAIENEQVEVRNGDAISGLPFHNHATLWFDHHTSAEEAGSLLHKARGKRGKAPSSARLIHDHYKNVEFQKYETLLAENDRISEANLTMEDVLNPQGWGLLSHTLDHLRRLDNYKKYANLIVSELYKNPDLDRLFELPLVKEMVDQYLKDAEIYKERIKYVSRIDKNIIITDLREAELLHIGNRFIIFALFPDQNVQLRLTLIDDKKHIQISMGKSIFNRTCNLHLGKLAAEFGGGGLEGAAGYKIEKDLAPIKIKEIIFRLRNK